MIQEAAAAALRTRVRRAARHARAAAREFAAVADGIDSDLVAAVRVTDPREADDVVGHIRSALAHGPVSVLITNQTTTAPQRAQEASHEGHV